VTGDQDSPAENGWSVGGDGSVEPPAAGDSSKANGAADGEQVGGEQVGGEQVGQSAKGVGPAPSWAVAADGSVEPLEPAHLADIAAVDTAAQAAGGAGGAGARRVFALATRADRTVASEARRQARHAGHGRVRRARQALQAHRERSKRRTWGQRLVLAAGVLTTIGFAAGATGITYAYRKVEQIPRVELGHVLADPVASGEARNVLLVGVDDTEGIEDDDPIHNEREDGPPLADTIMILRIDPADQKARILSLPRDLWVTFPETQASSRINTAIWRGDGRPDVLIDLINDFLGIPIHNYVQVDFSGFRDIVEEIDGVPVYFDHPGRDRQSGLHIYETGCVTLDAAEALGYVRARHYENYVDGEWEPEALSDLARVQRQQSFIQHTVDRAVNKGARNPGTMNSMVNAAVGGMALDDELSVRDLVDLGRRFQEFDPDAMETYVLPVEDDVVGGAQVLQMVEREAEPILERFRDGAPSDSEAPVERDDSPDDDSSRRPPVGDDREPKDTDPPVEDFSPGELRVTVLNGSGQSGQATEAANELEAAGFFVAGRDNASQFGQQRTEIRYPSDLAAEAAFLERWLADGAELVESTEVAEVTVVTGEDWDGVLDQARSPSADDAADQEDGVSGFMMPIPALLQQAELDEAEPSAEVAQAGGADEVDDSASTESDSLVPGGELPGPSRSC
jgi:LCP family protein required for cell wall assembly